MSVVRYFLFDTDFQLCVFDNQRTNIILPRYEVEGR